MKYKYSGGSFISGNFVGQGLDVALKAIAINHLTNKNRYNAHTLAELCIRYKTYILLRI